jgi:aspartate-semialdehyde dehydrogenase
MSSEARRRVAVVGATGMAGQQFLVTLQDHPWFEVAALAASERSAGKTYRQAISRPDGSSSWQCDEAFPERYAEQPVVAASELDTDAVDIVFSAVESDAARQLEPVYAATTPVISTASAFRYEDDVPVLVPGVNLEHAALLKRQQRERGWKGWVAPQPNCTTIGLVIALAPLVRAFGVERVFMTSLQALSGAGKSPGVAAMDVLDNVIPFIPQEEEKVEIETRKVLGRLEGESIEPLDVPVSATCTRVNVRDGHFESVTVGLGREAGVDEVAEVMGAFGREFTDLGLPSAPPELIRVLNDPYRPQPRLDRDLNDGMTTAVGRLRSDNALERGIKFCLLSHNTKMGAAKGAVLLAEHLVQQGLA